jgi:hypothetical protein
LTFRSVASFSVLSASFPFIPWFADRRGAG